MLLPTVIEVQISLFFFLNYARMLKVSYIRETVKAFSESEGTM